MEKTNGPYQFLCQCLIGISSFVQALHIGIGMYFLDSSISTFINDKKVIFGRPSFFHLLLSLISIALVIATVWFLANLFWPIYYLYFYFWNTNYGLSMLSLSGKNWPQFMLKRFALQESIC